MTKFSYRHIWQVAYPILISLLMEHTIGMTDTAFLGRVGEVELGASALAGVYYLAIYMLGFGFSIGAQIMIARRNGEGNYGAIGAIWFQGSAFLLVVAAVMFALSRMYSHVALGHLIESPAIYKATVDYMNWRVYGFFFSFLAVMFRAFYVGITHTKILTINSIVMVLSNVVLNYALIFGRLGMPELGIAGAAIGSSISELISVLFFVIYTGKRIDHKKYGLFKFEKVKNIFSLRGLKAAGIVDFPLLKNILDISVWTMIQYFMAIGMWFLFFIAVEHLGPRSLAVSNIVRSVSSFMFIVVSAYATTSSALVSNLMGAGQQRYVMATTWKVAKQCYMVVLPVMVLIMIFPEAVLRIYTDDISLINSSVPSMLVLSTAYLLAPMASVFFNAVSGTGNTRSGLAIEAMTLSVYVVYVYYIVVYLKSDVAISWTSEHVYWAMMFLISYIYMRRADWRSKKI